MSGASNVAGDRFRSPKVHGAMSGAFGKGTNGRGGRILDDRRAPVRIIPCHDASDRPVHSNIDAILAWKTRNPERFGVVVASNLFGDILSDAFAGLVGGLGFAFSANLGPEVSIFEPTHGSAPRHAPFDPPIVNPIATILAAALLAEHAGDPDTATRIRAAVASVVAEGRVRTYDMLRLPGTPDALSHGAATTRAMTEAVIGHL